MSAPLRHRHRFFTDRDLGSLIGRALRDVGADVVAHDDVFPDPTTPDTKWIRYTAGEGRVALTRNREIRYTPDELAAVRQWGARLIVLIGRRVRHPDWAEALSANVEKLYRFIDGHDAPYIAKLYSRKPTIEIAMWTSGHGTKPEGK